VTFVAATPPSCSSLPAFRSPEWLSITAMGETELSHLGNHESVAIPLQNLGAATGDA